MKNTADTYSDAELLALYRDSKKADYLVALYSRYTALVYGVALKYLKDVGEAEDAVMQIWEDLFEKVLKHDIQSFKSWLYVCVRNYCLLEIRKQSGNIRIELDERFMEFCDDFNLSDIEETEGHEKALIDCMEALPEKQRICVRYFFIEELSYKEIEKVSGYTQKMIKSFIQNGKRNLRLCLKEKGVGL